MRRRFALAWTLAIIVLALMLPASTMAATFTYTVKKNTCTASGGDHGYGHLYYRVRLDEYGLSGANRFTFDGKVQERSLGATRWRTDHTYSRITYTFPNNHANYYYVAWFSYDPGDFAWHRMAVTMKVWHGSTLLATRTVHGRSC